MRTFLYRQYQDKDKPKARELIATWQDNAPQELSKTVQLLNNLSDTIYTTEQEQPAHPITLQLAELQIDTTDATQTNRPIGFTLSWEHDGRTHRTCRAMSKRHGTIRGRVENSPKGVNWFLSKVQSFWPNSVRLTASK